MRSMAGGDYGRGLRMTFLPELVSMNAVMAGMAALSVPWLRHLMGPGPAHPAFSFVMSLALTLGFLLAYPMNWWLVAGRGRAQARDADRATRRLPSPSRCGPGPRRGRTEAAGHSPSGIPARQPRRRR
jgi:hypothetical protein